MDEIGLLNILLSEWKKDSAMTNMNRRSNSMTRRFTLVPVVFVFMAMSAWLSFAAAESASKGSLEQTFQKARQDYLQKDMKAAPEEVHKAAAWMKSEAAAAKGKGKEALAASSRELEKLAGELKKGTVKSVKEIEMSFARAYNALAANSHVKSAEAWSKKEFQKAGDELEAAADALGKAYTWAGQELKAGTQKVISESKELSAKLKEGARQVSADAGKAMKDLGQEIKEFGRKISTK
jgi:hypothetical protein